MQERSVQTCDGDDPKPGTTQAYENDKAQDGIEPSIPELANEDS
ncbi:MAG TPA: hypothetical protein VLZ74_05055 [Methylocella sp.]|nr:hypothetical protein [Methylocella sp.]